MENHSNINNQFIPYNLALELKELGFDEISLFCYATAYEGNPLSHCPHLLLNSQLEGFENEPISAPLWQQERMYSEEDMLNFVWFLKENLGQFSCDRTAHFEGKYIEQFKKK